MKIQVSQVTKDAIESTAGTKLFKFSTKGTFEIKVSDNISSIVFVKKQKGWRKVEHILARCEEWRRTTGNTSANER